VTPIALGVLLVWFGVAALASVTIEGALIGGLVVVGLGLVIGAFVGRARGLIVPALLLLAVLAATNAVDVPLRGGVGERFWAPASLAELDDEYRLAVGTATLDLRDVRPASATDPVVVTASVAIGELSVIVPPGMTVDARADVVAGEARLLGSPSNGIDVSHRATVEGTEGRFELHLSAGLGTVTVETGGRAISPETVPGETTETTEVPR
jgi:hypothetical protein